MNQNHLQIQQRLDTYKYTPDRRFITDSGFTIQEENVKQKLRQYWADERVPVSEKLKGFDMDLTGFDPRNTTNRELRAIAVRLADLGLIDYGTAGGLGGIDVDFDAQGNEINQDKVVDAFAFFQRNIEALQEMVAEGRDYARDTITKFNTDVSVMLALEEYAKSARSRGGMLVNVTA
jgi:hypothetical protein